jgi:hypothetical protein
MFFLKQDGKYWNGKEWIENWKLAQVYGSAATAVNKAPNRICIATGFTSEQWDAYYNKLDINNNGKH